MRYDTIIIIKVDQKLSDLFQGTHSQTFNKVKKSLRPSPLLKLKACFSRQVDVVLCRRIKANNFTMQGSKRGSRNTAGIIFRRMGIVRLPWWNDGIAP